MGLKISSPEIGINYINALNFLFLKVVIAWF